jgi:hypothetical protein
LVTGKVPPARFLQVRIRIKNTYTLRQDTSYTDTAYAIIHALTHALTHALIHALIRFLQVLRELGIGASLAYSEMEALVAAFDPHGSGKVDYEDFCRYY